MQEIKKIRLQEWTFQQPYLLPYGIREQETHRKRSKVRKSNITEGNQMRKIMDQYDDTYCTSSSTTSSVSAMATQFLSAIRDKSVTRTF